MVGSTYTTEFMNRITRELWLARRGNNAYYESGGNIIFRYDNPLTANLREDTLTLTMDFEIVIPISFASQRFFDLRIPLRAESVYVLKL
jgi:hypothetical protein